MGRCAGAAGRAGHAGRRLPVHRRAAGRGRGPAADLGVHVVLDRGDPLAAVRQAGSADPPVDADAVSRPQLSARQRDVLTAYVSSSDLLPTVARRLGMDPETMKTHLRRIRAKYSGAGRPAPTRRALNVRAVEDGLLPPPSGPSDR